MGKKISELTEINSAPSDAYTVIEHGGQNYKVKPSGFGGAGNGGSNIVAMIYAIGIKSPSMTTNDVHPSFSFSSDLENYPHIGYARLPTAGRKDDLSVFQNKTNNWIILQAMPNSTEISASSIGGSGFGYYRVNPNELDDINLNSVNRPTSLGNARPTSYVSGGTHATFKVGSNPSPLTYCLVEPDAAFGVLVFSHGQVGASASLRNDYIVISSIAGKTGDQLKSAHDASGLAAIWSSAGMPSTTEVVICDKY